MLRTYIINALQEGIKSIRGVLNDMVVRQHYPLTEANIKIISREDNKFKIIGIHNDIYNEIAQLEKDGIVRVDKPGDIGKKRGVTLVSLL